MRVFSQSFARQDGFTLVELMVVVAIVGLLSAVGVPTFKKYQAKAKITEAKIHLSAIYAAESSFFSDYNIYHNCLPYMGYDPGPEYANRYYTTGIPTTASISGAAYYFAVNSGLNSTACPNHNNDVLGGLGSVSAPKASWFPAGKGIGSALPQNKNYILSLVAIGSQSDAERMVFTAGAGGIISQDFMQMGEHSQLTINEKKELKIVVNGF